MARDDNDQDIFFGKGSFERLLALTPSSVYWKDVNGNYLGCNLVMSEFVGLNSPAEIIGKTDFDLPWWQAAKELRKNDEQVMASDSMQSFEEVGLLDDGRSYVALSNKMPLKNDKGEIIGVIGSSIDVTKLKEAQKIAEQASAVKSEFIANMSHDLRTPMTGVMGMLQELTHLKEDFTNALRMHPDALNVIKPLLERTTHYVGIAKNSTDQLLAMFNDILESMQLDSGKLAAQEEVFCTRDVVKKQIDLLRPTAEHKKLSLSFDVSDSVPTALFGYRRFLDRVLVNLIGNALKFTNEGHVSVKVTLLDRCDEQGIATLAISISDTGIGIPQDKFDTIFENFSRLTSSYEGTYEGTGLGLYAVKQYVDLMNGHISVDSEEGKGSVFTIQLPFLVSDQTPVTKEVAEKPATTSQASASNLSSVENAQAEVLIVEDNLAAANAAQTILNRLGCASDHASCGKVAIDMVSQKKYAFILMDIGLPDMSGLDVTMAIRRLDDAQCASVPIIALTGHLDKRDVCINVGMQGLLQKPAEASQLQSLVEQYIQANESAAVASKQCIDWEATIAILGDEAVAKHIASTCADDLLTSREHLATAYKAGDVKKMRELLHYIKGGVCYIKAPTLLTALQDFHHAIKGEYIGSATEKELYAILTKAIGEFIECVEAESK